MTKRSSTKDIKSLDDLNDLPHIVVDKRNEKRAIEKRNRRDRHYNKMFIKIAVKDHLEKDAAVGEPANDDELSKDESE